MDNNAIGLFHDYSYYKHKCCNLSFTNILKKRCLPIKKLKLFSRTTSVRTVLKSHLKEKSAFKKVCIFFRQIHTF
jgi:hypothetical protein